ncbi:MAG: aminoacyltransferase [Erysipelotrichaceae bacterium]|nr:aminoacyltransferase [Erysipelotrichaceae bacterium]MDY5252657.1 peptidoglycan bridge formation glycyltransferase FemA/FemB family protein [Erysipelotrichaceae bacterium]
MYCFKSNVSSDLHDQFVINHPLSNLLQSSNWAKIKDNWDHDIVSVFKDDKIVASSLALIKPLPANFCMIYLPRGPIMDYEDANLVHFFFQELKKWAKKKHCLFISFDPAIELRRFHLDNQDAPNDIKALQAIQTLEANGAIYKGQTMQIEQTIQPRFHMAKPFVGQLEKDVPASTIKSIKAANKRHVKVGLCSQAELADFSKMIALTEQHKNVHLRNHDYFAKIMATYPNNSYLYLAKVDASKYCHELEEQLCNAQATLKDPNATNNALKKAQQTINNVEKELPKIKALSEKYPQETTIAGGLMVGFGKNIEMLYAGRNDDFKAFRPQYPLYMYKIQHSFDLGYTFVNMGGVEGSLNDGLSTFKANFHPYVIEYVGEFDLPINKILYKLAKWAQKIKTGK